MRVRWAATVVIGAVLAMPAAAFGGGWATVELSSTPDGVPPGGTWSGDVTVLQHGVTPLEGVEPAVTVTEKRTGEQQTFPAQPTAKPGVYRFRVDFPRGGEWSYVVEDGFGLKHTYPPVQIDGTAADVAAPSAPRATDGGGVPWRALGAALAAGLIAAGLTVALQPGPGGMRRRMAPPTEG